MNTKVCNKCKEEKALEEFHIRNSSKGTRVHICKICARERDKAYYHKKDKKEHLNKNRAFRRRNRTLMWEYLGESSCITCGESDYRCLQFHHREPADKLYTISEMIRSRSWNAIKEEIDKCDILCANCHCKVTANQFNWYGDIEI
jgi:hypothetical protein